MREIEAKCCVDDLEALLVALKARGIELSDPVYQDDQAYAPDGWQFGDGKLAVSFVHLRTVDGRHYFAPKRIEKIVDDHPCMARYTARRACVDLR